MITNIASCCGNCKHWDEESEELDYRTKVPLRLCKLLDNDFCCGGKENIDAGVIGGGSFQSKSTFLCKYWEQI